MFILDIEGRDFPAPLVSINAIRGQTRVTSKKTAPWRDYGAILGRNVTLTRGAVQLPARVWVEFRFPTNQRRDTPNYYPTVKALLDGLVSGGLILDDRDGYIEGPLLVRTYPNGPERLRLIFEGVPAEHLGMSKYTEEQ